MCTRLHTCSGDADGGAEYHDDSGHDDGDDDANGDGDDDGYDDGDDDGGGNAIRLVMQVSLLVVGNALSTVLCAMTMTDMTNMLIVAMVIMIVMTSPGTY
eukprot:3285758-Pyramimonas_sp.AAC.1